jgi:Domain of unknown function (DUF397)
MMTPSFGADEFRKATRSNPTKDCVQIARRAGVVEVRDDKQQFGAPGDVRLRFTAAEFDAFLAGVQSGELAGLCIEITAVDRDVTVLRSTVPQSGGNQLRFTDAELLAFYDGVRRGEFTVQAFAR